MKLLTIILFVTIASAVGFSVLFQNKIEELSTQLDDVRTNLVDTEHQLTKAKRAQKEAEREMTVAQDQSETAYVNLHKVQRQLAEQKQRADHYEATSKDLKSTKTELSELTNDHYKALKEMVAKRQLEKALMEEIAAKDKKISELNAELSAAQNKN